MTLSPTEVLQAVPLFAHLGPVDLQALAALCRERRFSRGSVIVSQGEAGDAMFLIASGQLKVAVFAEDGREVILSVLTDQASSAKWRCSMTSRVQLTSSR